MRFKEFKDSKPLVDYAYRFVIEERLTSLQKDVKACLESDCAFPALLYCFSTIDLLGALGSGYAMEGSKTKGNFKDYVTRFMRNGSTISKERYSSFQADLLQDIFRHKIVHLAQPKLVVKKDSRLIAWRYEYPNTSNHLALEKIGYAKKVRHILTPKDLLYDHIFVISITQLMYDIVDSVIRPDGYYSKLQSDYKNLQGNFDQAIEQLYNVLT
ncbi:MAG TPA: hypothetical protein VE548_07205 [Nitrososphaeraceae archaeon]|nr:hypothetical protein [Nitrososphaeraceae archaeon]